MTDLSGNLRRPEEVVEYEEAIPDDASPADPRRFRRKYRGQRWYGDHLAACDLSAPMDFKARRGKEVEVSGPYYERTTSGLVELTKGVPKPMIVPSFTTISNAWPQEFFKNVKDANGNKYRVPLDALRTADWFLDNYVMVSQMPRETARALGAQFAVDDLNRRADEGTDIHLIYEAIGLGQPVPNNLPENLRVYVPAIQEWFDTVQPEVLFTEVVGFNWHLGYAFTSDIVFRVGDLIIFGDGKSKGLGSDGKLQNHGIYEKNTAQVAAAAFAEYLIVEDPNDPTQAVRVAVPKGTHGAVLSTRPDGVVTFPVDLEEGWQAFQHMLDCWRSLREGRSHARKAMISTKGGDGKKATARLDHEALAKGEIVLLPFSKDASDDDFWTEQPTFEVPAPPAPALESEPSEPEPEGDPMVLNAVAAAEADKKHAHHDAEVAGETLKPGDESRASYGPDPGPNLIKVLVTGSRDLGDAGRAAVFEALDKIHANAMRMVVVHGGCPTGADSYASQWVCERSADPRTAGVGLYEWVFKARWDAFGPSAGPLRNREMVLISDPAYSFAFASGSLADSKGTKSCVDAICSAQTNPILEIATDLNSAPAPALPIAREEFDQLPVKSLAEMVEAVKAADDPFEGITAAPDELTVALEKLREEPTPLDVALAEVIAEIPIPEPVEDTPTEQEAEMIAPTPPGYVPDAAPTAPAPPPDIVAARINDLIGAEEVEGEELAGELHYAKAFEAFLVPVQPVAAAAPEVTKEVFWQYVVGRIRHSHVEVSGRIKAGQLPESEAYLGELRRFWVDGDPAHGMAPQCPGIPFSGTACPPTYQAVEVVLALVDKLDNGYEPPISFGGLTDPRLAAAPRTSQVDTEGGLADPAAFKQITEAFGALKGTPLDDRLKALLKTAGPSVRPGDHLRTVRRCALLSAFYLLATRRMDSDEEIRLIIKEATGFEDSAMSAVALAGRLNLHGAQRFLAVTTGLVNGTIKFHHPHDGSLSIVDAAPAAEQVAA